MQKIGYLAERAGPWFPARPGTNPEMVAIEEEAEKVRYEMAAMLLSAYGKFDDTICASPPDNAGYVAEAVSILTALLPDITQEQIKSGQVRLVPCRGFDHGGITEAVQASRLLADFSTVTENTSAGYALSGWPLRFGNNMFWGPLLAPWKERTRRWYLAEKESIAQTLFPDEYYPNDLDSALLGSAISANHEVGERQLLDEYHLRNVLQDLADYTVCARQYGWESAWIMEMLVAGAVPAQIERQPDDVFELVVLTY